MLGHSGVEIFPKQDTIIVERGDVGNFINMPYFDAEMPQRYCFDAKGESMELDEFLDAIDKKSVLLSDLEAIRSTTQTRKHFDDGPPCIRNIFSDGPQSEPRNKLLFFMGVYCKKKFPDSWQNALEEYNRTLFSPPLPSTEVMTVIKQHEKKDWGYTCKEEPFKSYCDPSLCVLAKHGISDDAPDAPQVGGLTIMLSEPRLYFMDVNGLRIQLSTEQLQNQTLWQRACMEQCNFMPPTTKATEVAADGQQLDEPSNVHRCAGRGNDMRGSSRDHLASYCTSHIRAMAPEEIEMNKPWTDDGVTKFKIEGLLEYLHHRRFTALGRAQIIQMIRDMGGDSGSQNIVKRGGKRTKIRCWWVPAFEDDEVELPVQEIVMKSHSNRLLRVGEVADLLGVSRSYVYKLAQMTEDFPKAHCSWVRDNRRSASRWVLSEIEDWVNSRPRGKEYDT